jgi:acetamidase/formamidase
LTGPIFIEGVRPGDTVEVEVAELKTARYGWTSAGGPDRPIHQWVHTDSQEATTLQYRIDPERGVMRTDDGIELGLAPFMGWIGLAPAEEGVHSTVPPRRTGGNIDCRELQKGGRLFLPAEVEGGLLFFGDAHARQGDGEVAGPAVETGVEHLSLVVRRHEGQTLSNPFAYTASGYVTFGFAENLQDAAFEALNQMLTSMEISFGLTRPRAQALCSAALSVRVTQVVNGTKGCHAILP